MDEAPPPSEPPPAPRRWSTDPAVLEKEVVMSFFRAGGPGGQHRNKVETGVRLHHPPSGITVTATEGRSQYRNREVAMERLIAALKKRMMRRKKRVATKPTRGSKKRRVDAKKQRGQLKKQRKSLDD
jgi:protein subunit release factor B